MKTSNGISRLFAVLGAILAAAVLCICLMAREASPVLLAGGKDASAHASAMLSRLCAGDYAGASAYLYGSPRLDAGKERSSAVSQQIWDAFIRSLHYELVGDCYATTSGVAQKVRLESMDLSGVIGSLKEQAESLVSVRIQNAENMSDVYDANYVYRQDFVDAVIRDATDQAITNGLHTQREVTLNMVYEKGQWWVVPDQAFLNAISGGILG